MFLGTGTFVAGWAWVVLVVRDLAGVSDLGLSNFIALELLVLLVGFIGFCTENKSLELFMTSSKKLSTFAPKVLEFESGMSSQSAKSLLTRAFLLVLLLLADVTDEDGDAMTGVVALALLLFTTAVLLLPRGANDEAAEVDEVGVVVFITLDPPLLRLLPLLLVLKDMSAKKSSPNGSLDVEGWFFVCMPANRSFLGAS